MSNISLTTLGGVRENGKNMYIAEIGNSIFVLDQARHWGSRL